MSTGNPLNVIAPGWKIAVSFVREPVTSISFQMFHAQLPHVAK